ncbi:MAG: 3-isopropylmalate dehydratase small subunit [Actinomycetota bacterium]|nr:3-isopropylmalate dehydratase small subunit [Actinomycetota bacterium]
MKLKGRAHKFGDDISTDLIAPGRLFHLRTNLPELAKHVLEDADPNFAKKVKPGDLIVAGKNFGLGSSREHAAAIIKLAGVGGVLARSFARIFYRNAINVGLPALICDASQIDQGDELEVDIEKGKIRNLTKEIVIETKPLPKVMLNILEDGGLIEHFKKHGKFKL